MKSISNRLLYLHYDPNVTPEELFRKHQEFGATFPPVERPRATAGNGKIRVAYVSADFHGHVCACFLLPILETHDRSRFEIYCYAHTRKTDLVTTWFQKLAIWRDIRGVSDDDVMAQIAADGIEILVDCTGHAEGKRLTLFARRPAPVSVTFLGYPDTTGLTQIDYRLTDDVADPPEEGNSYATEELVRLPSGVHTFRPLVPTSDPAPPPVLTQGYITFGSFNKREKVNDAVLRAWERILKAVPNSRLLLKDGGWTAPPPLDVEPGRVQVMGRLPALSDHFAAYGNIDIALDTFPYSGTTTTCDALWMGVPVVTLKGNRHSARVSASFLARLGQDDLIATTVDRYIEIAVALAGDPARLSELRRTLKPEFLASPLGNPEAVTRALEAFFIGAVLSLDT